MEKENTKQLAASVDFKQATYGIALVARVTAIWLVAISPLVIATYLSYESGNFAITRGILLFMLTLVIGAVGERYQKFSLELASVIAAIILAILLTITVTDEMWEYTALLSICVVFLPIAYISSTFVAKWAKSTWGFLERDQGRNYGPEGLDSKPVGRFERYALSGEGRSTRADDLIYRPMLHFKVNVHDVIKFVRYAEEMHGGVLNERNWLSDEPLFDWDHYRNSDGSSHLTQGMFRNTLSGLDEWGYAQKINGAWHLSDRATKIVRHIASSTQVESTE